MRPALLSAFLLSLAAVTALPVGTAQDGSAAVKVLEEGAGDAPVELNGQATPVERWPYVDLTGLSIEEGNQTFVLTMSVAGLASDAVGEQLEYAYFYIDLVIAERPYLIDVYYSPPDLAYAYWCGRDGSQYECYDELQVTVDPDAGTFTFRLPRAEMVAEDGSPLVTGDVINGFQVSSEASGGLLAGGILSARDTMPDTGVGTIAYTVQHGLDQSGFVTLDSPTPVRVSNGEATTFLYELTVGNEADYRDTIELAAHGAPSEWIVTFPQQEVRLDGGERADVAALVTVPFNHDHGKYVAFNVTATSRSDPLSYSRLEMGIRYTRVPQPAGHHNTVWLHDDSGFFYINAIEEEEIPDDEVTSATSGGCGFSSPEGSGDSELFPLMPDLEMGIDTALDRTGTAHLVVQSSTPIQGTSSISGYFLVWDEDEDQYAETCAYQKPETAFLEIARSEPLQLEANVPKALDLAITPLPYGDRIDYAAGLHMGLLLVVWDEGANAAAPINLGSTAGAGVTFVEGSSFQLPIDEYHDPVDEYFSSLSGIELSSTTEQQRLVNPGETVVFRLDAQNIGLQPASFDLELTGAHTEWARILGDTRIAIGAGETRALAIAVDVPDEAFTGEMADVTLHAVKADDDNVRSLIRLLATVDDTEDHEDEADQVDGIDKDLSDKDAPALPWVAALAALALVAARRRRS
jgi:MYXO-CTERM domain-containing protein